MLRNLHEFPIIKIRSRGENPLVNGLSKYTLTHRHKTNTQILYMWVVGQMPLAVLATGAR